jgi:hypothetical protein
MKYITRNRSPAKLKLPNNFHIIKEKKAGNVYYGLIEVNDD